MTIALNMILGPFEEPFLSAAIKSVFALCDEFIFVDTAPGNNPNRKILDDFQNAQPIDDVKIIDMPRGEDKDFSYAAARELARINTESDWVLRLDADEVIHEKDIPALLRVAETSASVIDVEFYHFMVYPWLYQYTERKKILLRTNDFIWTNDVHEVPAVIGSCAYLPIHYYHYGYCRGQEEVFKRWQLYREIEGKPAWYDNLNPKDILTPRIPVCQNFTGKHPTVAQPILNELFKHVTPFTVKEIPKFYQTDNHVGLVLLTYNDYENLVQCLTSLMSTLDYPTFLWILDLGSTDGSNELLHNFNYAMNPNITGVSLNQNYGLEDLVLSLNKGFAFLMSRQECELIGWIHPDMVFEEHWLSELASVLNEDVDSIIGKVCSWNTRDGLPETDEIVPGHQQAYLIRRGVLLRVGLFDERFIGIGGWEDTDLNRRIIKEGYRVVTVPKSKVFHSAMATRSRRDTSAEGAHNREEYRKKWGDNVDGGMFI